MSPIEYLELIEKRYNPKNDSALADLLKIRPTSVFKYKKENRSFSDEVCIRVGKLLEIDPIRIITDMDAHRALSPAAKKYRIKIAKVIASVGIVSVGLCILCKKVSLIVIKDLLIITSHKFVYGVYKV